MTSTNNPIVHFDITGPDDEALRRFYGDLFGWSVDARGPGYALVTTPNLRGAIGEAETSSVTLGISVANLDDFMVTAIAHGAAVLMPPTNNGWVTKAQIADPCGNVLTVLQS
jgi:predicted enzyme related to lactoylglutathione lyase